MSEHGRLPRVMLWSMAAILGLGAMLYQMRGYSLFFAPSGAVDLKQRWIEQQYVFRGQNPYDVTYHVFGVGQKPWGQRDAAVDEQIGVPDSGGYPPWAFVSGALLFAGDWPTARLLYAALAAFALVGVGLWAYRLGAADGYRAAGAVLLAASAAISAYCTTLQVGQYGGLVTALLVTALVLCQRGGRWDWLGGLLLGVALLKPTIAGPFLLAVLISGRYRAVAAACAYLAIASAVIWLQTNTSPLEMLLQMLAASETFVHDSQGLVAPLLQLGLDRKVVTPLLAAVVLVPTVALLWAGRRRPLLDLFAIAAVAGRLWTYHKSYDNVMLVFLLIALGAQALRNPADLLAGLSFLLVGVSLWAPASVTDNAPFLVFQLVAWIGGLTVLLLRQPEPRIAPADERPRRSLVATVAEVPV
jgi:Glycosyltransferase family 87